MPGTPHDVKQLLADMLGALEAIGLYTADLSQTQFEHDRKTQRAVLFEGVQISEAAARLRRIDEAYDELLKSRYPLANWGRLRDLGNRYRHGYDVIDLELVWTDVHGFLKEIEKAVRAELALPRTEP